MAKTGSHQRSLARVPLSSQRQQVVQPLQLDSDHLAQAAQVHKEVFKISDRSKRNSNSSRW